MQQLLKTWFGAQPTTLLMVILSTVSIYTLIILYTRITGLRSFSKMSAADFAMTVAVGSLLGSAIVTPSPSVLAAAVALATLFALQWLIARLRTRSEVVSDLIDNQPILLMRKGTLLRDNMAAANVSMDDLHAKLREANVWRYDQVLAVIFETTGDISVVHAENAAAETVDQAIFADIRDQCSHSAQHSVRHPLDRATDAP